MQTYTLIDETTNKTYNVPIDEIFFIIQENPAHVYYKVLDNVKIKLHNDFIVHTKMICHRINTVDELLSIPKIFGLEIDIRDNINTGKLMLCHDPFVVGENLETFLLNYCHDTLILNIKSERTELKCLEAMELCRNKNYFFLDSSFPMTNLLYNQYNITKSACRFSEYEPIELYLSNKDKYDWVWVDCFTREPMTYEIQNVIKNEGKRICIVSPELQGQSNKIQEYRDYFIENRVLPDAICCKLYNIIEWI